MDSRVTQRARIADDLLRSIRNEDFPIGTKLPSERQLAETYGVSRPVVREALGMLATLDVIDIQMGRGAFVVSSDVSTESRAEYGLLDIVDARETIEAGALRLAGQRAQPEDIEAVASALENLELAVATGADTTDPDLELHGRIVEASRSPLLRKLWQDLGEEIAQTVRVSPHGRSMSREILEDHRQLAAGVTKGDLEAALRASAMLHDQHRAFLRSLLS